MHERSSLDEGRLRDWMLDVGLAPPEDASAWARWWAKAGAALSEFQRERVWAACDRVRFHEVVECPERRVAYVVVGINWHYSDQDFYAGAEGGSAVRAFSDRKKAEEFARKQAGEERLGYNTDEPFRLLNRIQTQTDPLHLGSAPEDVPEEIENVEDVPMFEVVEVEVEE
jgi:hypothetical protein